VTTLAEENMRTMVAGCLLVPKEAVTELDPANGRATVDLRAYDGDFDESRIEMLPAWLALTVIPRGYVPTIQATVRLEMHEADFGKPTGRD
jgi:hypothetical protein